MSVDRFFSAFGWRGGLCDRFRTAADDLTSAAKQLQSDLKPYNKAKDPFAAMLSSMWNNHQWAEFTQHPVDMGNGSGVGKRPIDTAARPPR